MSEQEKAIWLLRRKLVTLAGEMRHWKKVSRGPQTDFRTNHYQIRAFALMLDTFSRAIHVHMREPGFSGTDAYAHTKDVLALFRIWEFLRSRLAQRLEGRFRRSLQVADEFAFACYEPAAKAQYKEPPLVFLNGGFSPFILPRGREFQAEFVPNELIEGEELLDAMSRLPFPVIGVPWYQVEGAWELPVIAHEVGHSIEGDLGLANELRTRVKAEVPPERQDRWVSWCSEVFADYYGCHAVGPSFLSTLGEFLAGISSTDGKHYPPTSIRLELNFAFLGTAFDAPGGGVPSPMTALRERFSDLLRIPTEFDAFKDDAGKVAESLRPVDVKLPRFSVINYVNAYKLAALALKEKVNSLYDVREVAAALRIGYDASLGPKVNRPANRREYLDRLRQLEAVLLASGKPDIRTAIGSAGDQAGWDNRKAAHLARASRWFIGKRNQS
jgi:hypothetical protein